MHVQGLRTLAGGKLPLALRLIGIGELLFRLILRGTGITLQQPSERLQRLKHKFGGPESGVGIETGLGGEQT